MIPFSALRTSIAIPKSANVCWWRVIAMIKYILSFLEYDFVRNALIIGLSISVCCALLGVSLVLKRFSMIGDGLSHVGFGASAIALALGFAPLYVAIPIVIIAAFLALQMCWWGVNYLPTATESVHTYNQ